MKNKSNKQRRLELIKRAAMKKPIPAKEIGLKYGKSTDKGQRW